MGWNTVARAGRQPRCSPGWSGERFYFVHSYAVRRWELPASDVVAAAAGDLGRARRAVRRGGRERAAVGDPVPPGEVRRRRGRAAAQLGAGRCEPGAGAAPRGAGAAGRRASGLPGERRERAGRPAPAQPAQALRGRLPRRVRYRGQQGLLARRRRAQNAVILLLFLAVQAIVWLVCADPWARAAGRCWSGCSPLPVLVTLTLDRRS